MESFTRAKPLVMDYLETFNKETVEPYGRIYPSLDRMTTRDTGYTYGYACSLRIGRNIVTID
jgi:hypothetical protein